MALCIVIITTLSVLRSYWSRSVYSAISFKKSSSVPPSVSRMKLRMLVLSSRTFSMRVKFSYRFFSFQSSDIAGAFYKRVIQLVEGERFGLKAQVLYKADKLMQLRGRFL